MAVNKEVKSKHKCAHVKGLHHPTHKFNEAPEYKYFFRPPLIQQYMCDLDLGSTGCTNALKTANASGRFWLKLDGTDVKVCLMESVKGVWNGDVDLGDGQLNQLQTDYETHQQVFKALSKSENRSVLEESLKESIDEFQLDQDFLLEGLSAAVKDYRNK